MTSFNPEETGHTAEELAGRHGEDLVFYTTYSDVYHTDPDCPHLDGSRRVHAAESLSALPEPWCKGNRGDLELTECRTCAEGDKQ